MTRLEFKEKLEDSLTEMRLAISWHENQIKAVREQIKVIKSVLED